MPPETTEAEEIDVTELMNRLEEMEKKVNLHEGRLDLLQNSLVSLEAWLKQLAVKFGIKPKE